MGSRWTSTDSLRMVCETDLSQIAWHNILGQINWLNDSTKLETKRYLQESWSKRSLFFPWHLKTRPQKMNSCYRSWGENPLGARVNQNIVEMRDRKRNPSSSWLIPYIQLECKSAGHCYFETQVSAKKRGLFLFPSLISGPHNHPPYFLESAHSTLSQIYLCYRIV